MRSVGLVALGWRVPGAQAQGMVRACEQGAGSEQCTWQVGRVLWLWGSERASEVTGARDGSAYGGSLTKLTEAVEFESARDEKRRIRTGERVCLSVSLTACSARSAPARIRPCA